MVKVVRGPSLAALVGLAKALAIFGAFARAFALCADCAFGISCPVSLSSAR